MASSKETSLRDSRGSKCVPDAGENPRANVSSIADTRSAKPAPAWDPYQVWLTRVKQPRDETRRQRRLDQQEQAQGAEESAEDAPIAADPRPSRA